MEDHKQAWEKNKKQKKSNTNKQAYKETKFRRAKNKNKTK